MFYTRENLINIGFKKVGENVLLSDKSSIYNPQNIEIGDNVRIDDFVILSPSNSLKIGSYVHIGCHATIIGAGEITLEDFSGISGKVSIYSSTDDYSGIAMTNPMVTEKYRKVTNGAVIIKKHAIVGCGSVILPNVVIGEGCSIGALSLVNKNCDEFTVYAGIPVKKISNKSRKVLIFEDNLKNNQ